MEEIMGVCAVCGHPHSMEELYDFDGAMICEDCMDEQTVVCARAAMAGITPTVFAANESCWRKMAAIWTTMMILPTAAIAPAM